MRYGDMKEEEQEDNGEFVKSISDAIAYNKSKFLNESPEKVKIFCEFLLDKILDSIDEVKDDEVAGILSSYASIAIGSMGETIIKLKEDNEMMSNELELGKMNQNPELN